MKKTVVLFAAVVVLGVICWAGVRTYTALKTAPQLRSVKIVAKLDSGGFLSEALTRDFETSGIVVVSPDDRYQRPDLVIGLNVIWFRSAKSSTDPDRPSEIVVDAMYDGPIMQKTSPGGITFSINRLRAGHTPGNYREEDLAEAASERIIADVMKLVQRSAGR